MDGFWWVVDTTTAVLLYSCCTAYCVHGTWWIRGFPQAFPSKFLYAFNHFVADVLFMVYGLFFLYEHHIMCVASSHLVVVCSNILQGPLLLQINLPQASTNKLLCACKHCVPDIFFLVYCFWKLDIRFLCCVAPHGRGVLVHIAGSISITELPSVSYCQVRPDAIVYRSHCFLTLSYTATRVQRLPLVVLTSYRSPMSSLCRWWEPGRKRMVHLCSFHRQPMSG